MSNPTTSGEWTAKPSQTHGWYIEFDRGNGASIGNELTAKGIVNAHNAALSAERESMSDELEAAMEAMLQNRQLRAELAAEREKVDNATENCMSLSKLLYDTRQQLAAEREVGGNTAVALAQQITKLEDQLKKYQI